MTAKASATIPVSILDWAPIRAGETPGDALRQATDFARYVEALGFKRFWVTEHHGIALAASAATPVVIAHIAGKTSTIRVGSGGIMLPNHPPLIIAEQFGTLASLYPGRIDLGLGRASGGAPGDEAVLRALRLSASSRERFPLDVRELQSYFRVPQQDQEVVAVPGAGIDLPIWLLGSSDFSAAQAGALGLPFAFATQIGHKVLNNAVKTYRSSFKQSGTRTRPYLMICALVVAAETDRAAQHLLTSIQQVLVSQMRGANGGRLPAPVWDLAGSITDEEHARLDRIMPFAIVGSGETVRREIESLISETEADELMIMSFIHDQNARHSCVEIVADICQQPRLHTPAVS
jgi:luciferase family oxidoreductase group 1